MFFCCVGTLNKSTTCILVKTCSIFGMPGNGTNLVLLSEYYPIDQYCIYHGAVHFANKQTFYLLAVYALITKLFSASINVDLKQLIYGINLVYQTCKCIYGFEMELVVIRSYLFRAIWQTCSYSTISRHVIIPLTAWMRFYCTNDI